MQLNNVLGRTNYAPPLIHDGDTNTHRGLNIRYDHLHSIMVTREMEIPALNRIHSSYITSRFLRALNQDGFEVEDGYEGQEIQEEADAVHADAEHAGAEHADAELANAVQTDPIDLSDSQIDLNDNIQPQYPETSATSFNEEENFDFTGSYSTGNGNEAEQGEEPATNYREMAQNLISQQLASANVDSFALIYGDGTAHFQGSNSVYDLSSIEPVDGANSTIESNENPEIDWPLQFEN